MNYQGNREVARRGQEFEVLAPWVLTLTSSDKCASEDTISESQGERAVVTLNGATRLAGE